MLNNRVAIIIPTKNRPEFIARQLGYYANLGCLNPVYIGDSSGHEQLNQTTVLVDQLRGRLRVGHTPLPGMNESEAMDVALASAAEPYAGFVGDDDFLVPASLEKAAEFLGTHPGYSMAHGLAIGCRFDAPVVRGKLASSNLYGGRHSVEQDTGSERLRDFLGACYSTLFSVHRTEDFRSAMKAALPITNVAFRELLVSCLPVIKGKVKQLDGLYLVRQGGATPGRLLGDQYDWITSPGWQESYEVFRDALAAALASQDSLDLATAQGVVKEAFWSYLVSRMGKSWNARISERDSRLRSRSRDIARRYPLLRKLWRVLNRRQDPDFSLGSLLRRSSPYHRDFMPIYRAFSPP